VARSNIFRTNREVTLLLLAQNSVGRCRGSRVFMQWVCSTCDYWLMSWEVQECVVPFVIFVYIEYGGLERNSMLRVMF